MDAGAARGERADELTGTSFGRYRIHRRIASGGMASVYLASFQAPGGFNKLVALKRIHDHLAHETDFAEMFLDEARIAARIAHPNVCQVFDFGEVEGSYYLSMEYLTGETFRQIPLAIERRGTEIPWWAPVAALAGQAAEGLHAAHELTDERGQPLEIVHRDVSPANLFATYSGCVKVMDFGIARAEGRSHHTRPGVIKGKFSYVAPEQARGRPVDRRADVWALGVTLWELLTLRSLFRRENELETLRAVVHGDLPPPSHIVSSVPEALDEVVMGALRREPAERYATARDFSRALDACLRSLDERVGPVELEEWMKLLFAPEVKKKRAMERAALEHSDVRPLPTTPAPAEEPVDLSAFDPPAPGPATETEPPPRRRGRSGLWIAAAVTAAAAVGAFAATSTLSGGDEDPMARAASAPSRIVMPTTTDPSERADAPRARREAPAAPETGVGPGDEPALAEAGLEEESGAMQAAAERGDEGEAEPTGDGSSQAARAWRWRRARALARQRDAAEETEEREGDAEPATEEPEGGPLPEATDEEPARDPDPVAVPEQRIAAPEPAEPRARPTRRNTDSPSAPSSGGARSSSHSRSRRTSPTPAPSLEARTAMSSLRVDGSLPPSVVQRAVRRYADEWASCYRNAARRAQRDSAGRVRVALTIDEMGAARGVRAQGGPLPGVSACVAGSLSRMRAGQRPDTGRVRVTFDVLFRPVPRR